MTVATPELMLRSMANDWTLTRWETLPADGNRYEVLDGVLYMTTAPSAFHQWIGLQVLFFLQRELVEVSGGIVFIAPIGLVMPGSDPSQPDLLYLRPEDRGAVRDRRIYGIPALIVEILSPSNPEHDLVTKRAIYAGAGVPEYWIVRPATRDALVLSDPDPLRRAYRSEVLVPAAGELVAQTLPLRAPVARFFADAPDTTL
jgi:Uma2 family endonuclease